MHILAILILLAFPVFANADTQAQNFIPGEPMRFPMKSAGVADNLVELYSVNCKAEDISVQSNCLALLEERGDSCTDQPPEIGSSAEFVGRGVMISSETACSGAPRVLL